ncbi:N-acetylglucosamine-6-sulfatase-like isoform X2 [Agrilus planipennis]|uniref:N-acetylglucosamine-6-sulfatase-like isoform X2 n=2 Tax=Agrilus planipennis TaxID=224129 RepID=A0A7F5R081_AGRPL|nr:N-acetylglucosamine-6-sulfatase-like isoform X2 [Agrilus planipennis]
MFITLFLLLLKTISGNTSLSANVILIITDDQDVLLNGLKPMSKTVKLLGNKGVIFENAYTNSPICCPSRSTILTGKYLHNTGVVNNSLSGNCSSVLWQKMHEPHSVAPILKKHKEYVTFYSGKYLNQYGHKSAGGTRHVPEGYDWWIGLKGNSIYYNYTLSVNGTAKYFNDEYLTDILKEYSLDFLNQKFITQTPFFMTIATPAPHQPFTPANRHKKSFPGTKVIHTPSFNFSSKGKHWIVGMPPKTLPEDVSELDKFQKLRMQSLLAVDELVESIIYKLETLNLLKSTFLIFTSDNGYHLGQFTQPYDKRQPYETDIKIPLMIRGPKIKKKSIFKRPVSLVDLAPTILEMANIKGTDYQYQMDGKSFLKNIKKFGEPSENDKVFVEYFGETNEREFHEECDFITDPDVSHCTQDAWCKCSDSKNNTFTCVITFLNNKSIKFCKFQDNQNFTEVYDLKTDPYELHNIFENFNKSLRKYYEELLETFKNCKGNQCNF